MRTALIGVAVLVVLAIGAYLVWSVRAGKAPDIVATPAAPPAPTPHEPPPPVAPPVAPIGEAATAPAPPPVAQETDPVRREALKLTRMHLRDRWEAAEHLLERKIPDGPRERLEMTYARVAAASDFVVRQRAEGRMSEPAALARLTSLREEYRREALSQIGLTDEQLLKLSAGP